MRSIILNLLTQAISTLQLPDSANDITSTIHLERTRDPAHGDFAANIAMVLAKTLKQNPRQLAQQIIANIPHHNDIAKIEIAGPGFINFYLTATAQQRVLAKILAQAQGYGRSSLGSGKKIHMELVSTNPTGPLHVGHGRIAAYGGSLADILEAVGYQVHREYYVNDAGRQMQILTVSIWLRYLELWGESLYFPSSGYKGKYIIDIAEVLKGQYGKQFLRSSAEVYQDITTETEANAEQYIDALIQRGNELLSAADFNKIFNLGLKLILADIREDLAEFGIVCQQWYSESEMLVGDIVKQGLAILRQGNYLYEEAGAIWFKATEFGDEKDRVVIKENGQTTYFASDIGYHFDKYQRGFDQIIDIYGADHHGYIPRLRALIQALGKDVNRLQVQLVQLVALYRGKVKLPMSTRAGEFVTLRELRTEIGNDAARYFYIMRRHDQHLDFDLELAKSKSNDNPVYYIQYAHARICSVFHQLALKQWQWDKEQGLQQLQRLHTEHEKDLLRCLATYPEIIELAAQHYEPYVLANYLQELANYFHAYYNAQQFLVEDSALRDARLCLIAGVRQVLANGLKLLGLSAPEVM